MSSLPNFVAWDTFAPRLFRVQCGGFLIHERGRCGPIHSIRRRKTTAKSEVDCIAWVWKLKNGFLYNEFDKSPQFSASLSLLVELLRWSVKDHWRRRKLGRRDEVQHSDRHRPLQESSLDMGHFDVARFSRISQPPSKRQVLSLALSRSTIFSYQH